MKLVKHDLEFILRQIKIAEANSVAHSGNTARELTDILVDRAGNPVPEGTPNAYRAIPSPLLPYGLRTVDGSFTNLVEGRELWGAADQIMPRLLAQGWRVAEHGSDHAAATLPGFPDASTQTHYADAGWVVDSLPRTISNLIADQSAHNPAAVAAMLAAEGNGCDPENLFIPNVAPDEGLSAPFNSWMTLFGQFFDHGLDLIARGEDQIFIPLKPDDPLYDPASPGTNFMLLTRAKTYEDPAHPEVRAHLNHTTPFVDQNQTYTSHPSHQVFLREYVMTADGPLASGRLLGGDKGLPTWADVKAQARELLGIELADEDTLSVPQLLVDPYGEFIRGDNGYPLLVTTTGLVEGNPLTPIGTAAAVRTGHAFLADIAHGASPATPGYDATLLDAHFVTGDGRGNENIGLTAVHHVFHAEHNRMVEHTKQTVLESGDLAFLNEWLRVELDTFPDVNDAAALAALQWDGERLFQSGRFTTEIQYQHLVFEEFARKIQPSVDAFDAFPEMSINPAIYAEFAHVVYRFGHSMLTETVERINADGSRADLDLITAFLNPTAFADGYLTHAEATGAIVRGMTRQTGNAIDEFVTGALRNNLLGLPLDLAAINIARGRDTGVPSLNAARAELYAATGDSRLEPYTSWFDFALNLSTPASIINFIASYGTHPSIVDAQTLDAKREAALRLVMGGDGAPADRLDFLNGSAAWAGVESGLNHVDLWIGGLAEKKMPFGGMLGSTFAFVFELQMENLQDGDRFYYLSRVQGTNMDAELEGNSFATLIKRNTDLGVEGATHLPGDIFARVDHIIELDATRQLDPDPVHDDPLLKIISPKVERRDTDGDGIDDYLRFHGDGQEHVVLGGSARPDTLMGHDGDDTLWGDGGNDRLEGGNGNDILDGGHGDDIITDLGGNDIIRGGDGNDVIHAGNGLDQIMGGHGKDYILAGSDGSEVLGGEGDDFIVGGDGADVLNGDGGDDWIEGGGRSDVISGDHGERFLNATVIGHDVLHGGNGDIVYRADSGDDIMFGGEGIQRSVGAWGFDWVIHKGQGIGVDADLNIEVFPNLPIEVVRDRFSEVEALSGWAGDDILRGDDRTAEDPAEPTIADPTPEGNFVNNELDQAGIERIAGLDVIITPDLMQEVEYWDDGSAQLKQAFVGGNILLGGGGSDTLEGRGGDDVLDGDAWLNVRIRIIGAPEQENTAANEIASVDHLDGDVTLGGTTRSLRQWLLDGLINPGQLHTVREILYDDSGEDTAVFWDVRQNYSITDNGDGSWRVEHLTFNPLETDPLTGRNRLSDGVDTVRNVEYLRFAFQTIDLRTFTSDNRRPVVPEPAHLGLLALGDTLLITSAALLAGVTDADGDDLQVLDLAVSSGTLVQQAPDAWLYSPAAGATPGQVTFSFGVFDGTALVQHGAALDLGAAPETVIGSMDNDVIVTADGDDLVKGRGGHDEISSLGGSDTVHGGGGGDTVHGGDGDDVLYGDAGHDVLYGGAGDDVLYGGRASDQLFGGEGDDTLVGEHGADEVFGEGGNDVFLATVGDGNDRFYGGEGDDTLDLSAISADVTVNLGNGLAGLNGKASSAQTGTDRLHSIENAITGTGNDTILASTAVNVMDGGAGEDIFVFRSVRMADGDVIVDFEPGDRIDLSAVDADRGTAGHQSFVLLPGVSGGAGELRWSNETVNGEAATVLRGHINGDGEADFTLTLTGMHPLGQDDFLL